MLSELVFLLFCKMNAVTLHCQFSISNVVLPSSVPHSSLFRFLAAKRATRKKIRRIRYGRTTIRSAHFFRLEKENRQSLIPGCNLNMPDKKGHVIMDGQTRRDN